MRFFLIFLALISSAFAEHIYLNQSGTGDGTSVAQAKAATTFFNNAGNWDSLVNTTNGKIGPGDTVHLVGIFEFTGASTTSSNTLTFQGAGTVAAPITLKFDTGSKIRHPHGFPTGLINGTVQNVIIEGQNSSPVFGGSFVGIDLEIWNNGTTLGNQVASTRIMQFPNGANTNVTIKNLYLYGAYVRTENSLTDAVSSANIVSIAGQHNIVIDNCRFEHGEGGVGLTGNANPSTGFRVTNSWFYGCSTAVKIGAVDGTTNEGVVVNHNRIDGFHHWAGLPSAHPQRHHTDGIQTILGNNGFVKNITAAYNHIGPNLGLYGSHNAHIYFQFNVNGSFIYNNLLTAQSTPLNPAENNAPPGCANGFSTGGTAVTPNYFEAPGGVRSLVANNTIIGAGSGQGISTSFANVYGNIIINTSTMISVFGQQAPNAAYGQFVNSGKNIFFHPGGQYQFGAGGLSCSNLGCWQSHPNILAINGGVGFDVDSIISNPNPNFNTGAISAGSSAIGFAPTQTLFNDDLNSAIRSVPWDAGAVEFASTAATPPTVVSSSINAAGTQFALVLSEAVVFGAGGNGGMILTATGGTVTLGTPSISGTTITWPITNRLIGQGESLTRAYTQPNNGIEASDDGLDLSSFAALLVTNGSTVAQAGIPVFAPVPGAYSSTQNVAITSSTPPSGVTIRYTTDGTDPTASTGTLYTTPIPTSLSTTYKARAFAGGFLDSPVATGAYQIGDFIINTSWSNVAVTSQTGAFTWSFRATPSATGIDGLIALADHNAGAFTDLAVILRFNSSGRIDAINTGDYAAVNNFTYVGGQAYDFVVTVNVPNHTYSVTVVQAGGSTPTTIATNYGFRSQQASVNHLDVFSGITATGTISVSNMVFTGAAPTLSLTGIATNTSGTQITASFNSQPSFGLGGQGGFTVSASGGATTPASPTVGTNSITWNLSRTIGRGETISATYVQPGNGIEAASGGADLASFAGQSAVNNSTVDLTAPIPNPSTFGIAPTALTSSTITMTATNSTDATLPVQYFFNEVSGNAGGSDSAWQPQSTFTDAGLAAGTQYRYRVQVRDSAVPPNVTTFSQEFSATTKSVAGAHPAMPFNMARANIVTP